MLQLVKDWWPYFAGIVAALWAAYVYFDKRRRDHDTAKTLAVKADHGSISVGNMSGGKISQGAADGVPKDGS